VIRGRRVQLRPVEEDDVPLILRWRNSPEVWWEMDHVVMSVNRDEFAAARARWDGDAG
jgi:RimJ/RimL family protein N-acetyltransferase